MSSPFDIFRTETSGRVLWLESAVSLEDAKARAQQIAAHSPGQYLLLDQKTGSKHFLQLDPGEPRQAPPGYICTGENS